MPPPPLPSQFSYLSDVVGKYTLPHGDVAEYEERLDRLTPADVAELAAGYGRLESDPEAVKELSAWIRQQERTKREVWDRWLDQEDARVAGRPLPGPPTPEPETPDPPQAFYLFLVFDLLRQRHVAPFNRGRVKYSPPPPKLDWTKLPEPLRWLAGPAEKYGKHQFHGDRAHFARRIKSDERAELRDVVRRLWSGPEILKRFQEWCTSHPASRGNPETNLLNNLWECIVGIGEADDDRMPDWMRKR